MPATTQEVKLEAGKNLWGKCRLKIDRESVTLRANDTITWRLDAIADNCLTAGDLVKITMKWRTCGGRSSSYEPVVLGAPSPGFQSGTAVAAPVPGCYKYNIFAGPLFRDPELVLDQ